jgi:UDP-N-acetylglucosamine--N-acetylmuramyl-(pentapeptide) pyrophosphoryl-undecaprenol N-acetylglucosamine transferase
MNRTDSETGAAGKPARIAIAAGGTGGHVMPALALGEALRDAAPETELLYFSGRREQEVRWYGQAGVAPVQLAATPLGKGVSAKTRGALNALRAYLQARKYIRRWKPDCVVGFGGYASGPCLLAASRMGLPTVIHEQNAVAGKTNRWLAKRTAAVATTYAGAFGDMNLARLETTGNPIRKSVLAGCPKEKARRHFGLKPDCPTLLVSGGSQGAMRLNEALLSLLGQKERASGATWQALWIAGAGNIEEVEKGLAETGPPLLFVKIVPFAVEMGLAYAAADAVLCRAGSNSLGEAAAFGLPMIAVPFPWAAENHQLRNALHYAEAGACIVLEESSFSPESVMDTVDSILGDDERRSRMSEAARSLARPDAARSLARLVFEIAGVSAS